MKDKAYSEALLVRYLFGDLPEEEQVEIEDRAFRDRECMQNILAVESDLIDEYVRGELSDSERLKFEDRFLASAERRRKVDFAKALTTVAPEFAVKERDIRYSALPDPVTWQTALAALIRGLSPAIKCSMAAAALLAVIAVSWLVMESRRLRAELAELRAERQALQQQMADESARNEEMAARLEREQEQRARSQDLASEMERQMEVPTTRPSQPAIVSLALLPGISRSAAARPKLVIPQSARLVRLRIGIEPEDEYKSFHVELRGQGEQTIWSQDNLSARRARAGLTVVLSLPASILGPGQYELTLKGVLDDGRVEEIGYYYFDVLKK